MHAVWTICKREVNAFFDSLTAYVLLVIFLGISGTFTWLFGQGDIFFVGEASLDVFFQVSFWTLFFFIPAVTMGMVAEERRSGTLELLATKPIDDLEIVTGKWLAAWSLVAVALAFTLPYYITVAQLGPIDHGATVSGYLGLLFVSAVYVSIGLFASSLTSNQVIAFLLSLFVAAFLHLLFGQMASILPGPAANVAEFLDLQGHFRTMSRGVVDAASVLYVGALTVLGLLAATVSLKSRRWS